MDDDDFDPAEFPPPKRTAPCRLYLISPQDVGGSFPDRLKSIVGDETVGYRIVKEIRDLGATGYNYHLVQGYGGGGERPRRGEPGNTKIEVICTAELAHRILEHVGQHYCDKYKFIAFLDDVEVLRGEKFGLKPL